MSETTENQKLKDRSLLEGALGYCLRIAEKINKKEIDSLEDLDKIIAEDTDRINGALTHHFLDDLKTAGWTTGLFEDKLQQPTQN